MQTITANHGHDIKMRSQFRQLPCQKQFSEHLCQILSFWHVIFTTSFRLIIMWQCKQIVESMKLNWKIPLKLLKTFFPTSSVNIFVTGMCWQLMPGGGCVVDHINEDGLLSGSNIAYIYPDNVTALVGQFLNCTFVR